MSFIKLSNAFESCLTEVLRQIGQGEPKKQDQPKPQLHPYVQELLRRVQDQQPQPPATTPKEIYHRKRALQLARAIR